MDIAERIKADIQAILRKALSPVMNEFKNRTSDGEQYTKWGLVEEEINKVIDKYFNPTDDHIDNEDERPVQILTECGKHAILEYIRLY